MRLPADLRAYLTQVSREVFVRYWPVSFVLDVYEEEEEGVGRCEFPLGEVLIYHETDSTTYHEGMMRIEDVGCSEDIWIVVTGNRPGSVWVCDGPSHFKEADSFTQYLTESWRYRHVDWSSCVKPVS